MRPEKKRFEELLDTIHGIGHLFILLHDGPDPDSLAGSMGLQQFLQTTAGCRCTLLGGGYVQRPDNQSMIRLLNIELEHPGSIRMSNDTAPFICIDTQPGFSNNSLPAGARVLGVIDHHVSDVEATAPFVDIRPEFGASASIIAQYFMESGTPMHKRVATALAFAIASETRDMERVKKQVEVDIYMHVLSRADHPVLGQFRNPKIERDYVRTLSMALDRARLYTPDVLVCHLPKLPRTDDLGRLADFFDQMEAAKWTLCSESREDEFLLSIRSSVKSAKCEEIAEKIIRNRGAFGGHGMMAGGVIKRDSLKETAQEDESDELTLRFLKALGRAADNPFESLLSTGSRAADDRGGTD